MNITINKKTGYLVRQKIKNLNAPKYKNMRSFSEGYAAVQNEEGLWGFVDESGKEVISCQYEDAFDFQEGYARVQNEKDLWGFVDGSGKEVISCQHENAFDFQEGYARVLNEKGLWGFVGKTRDKDIACQYKDVGNFHEGYARVQSTNKFFNVIDKSNTKKLLEPYQVICTKYEEEFDDLAKENIENLITSLDNKDIQATVKIKHQFGIQCLCKDADLSIEETKTLWFKKEEKRDEFYSILEYFMQNMINLNSEEIHQYQKAMKRLYSKKNTGN